MLKTLTGTLLMIALLALSGCAAVVTASTVSYDEPITLEEGETVILQDDELTLSAVNDSRCPADATCITAGEALLTFTNAAGDEVTITYEAEDLSEPVGQLGNLQITITDLQPYPSTATQGQPKTATFTLTVTE